MQPLTESNILSCLPHWNNSIFHFHVSMWWKIVIVPKLVPYPRAGSLILSVVWNNENNEKYWTHYFLMLGWKWKTRLTIERITVETGHRLTNIRYGDDLMLYTTSGWTELHAVGLECNARKIEMLTTSNFVHRNRWYDDRNPSWSYHAAETPQGIWGDAAKLTCTTAYNCLGEITKGSLQAGASLSLNDQEKGTPLPPHHRLQPQQHHHHHHHHPLHRPRRHRSHPPRPPHPCHHPPPHHHRHVTPIIFYHIHPHPHHQPQHPHHPPPPLPPHHPHVFSLVPSCRSTHTQTLFTHRHFYTQTPLHTF